MKQRNLTSLILGIFTIVFLTGAVNAAMDFNPSTITGSGTQGDVITVNFVINNTATQNMTSIKGYLQSLTSGSNTLASSNLALSSVPSYLEGLDNDTVTLTVSIPSSQAVGTYTGNITFEGTYSSATNYSVPVSITVTAASSTSDICKYDNGVSTNNGELDVRIKDVSVIKGFGKDEEWLPFDEIEVEIKVENNGDYNIDDISLEWGITDDSFNDWVVELDEIDNFKLKDGKEDTFTITFNINEKDFDMDFDEFVGNNYNLVVRATGTIDDNDAGSLDGQDTCASDSEEISIEEESDFVILNKVNLPEIVSCGEDMQITADVWNIGSDDQDDVKVKIYNKELGISEIIEFNEIRSYRNEDLNVLLKIPKDAQEKTYILTFEVYDEDNDIYENDYDEDESKFTKTFTIEGNCRGTSADAIVSASLESGGKAGEKLTIKATITNTGDDSATYNVNAATYASWANSVDVSPATFVIGKGESKTVTLTFDVKKDASGENNFDIEVLSEGQLVVTQPVSVQIAKSGFSIPSEFSLSFVITTGIITVLILIAIVILIIRLIR